ncbi:MAG: SMP-30/gluconolactonase/LRE family protein [Desulfatiglandales bacterium]
MEISEVKTLGTGIVRPEGVMALDDGTILTADGRERCSRISRDGQTQFFGSVGGTPNGICVDSKGNCIIANIGNGQVQSLFPDGRHEVLLTEVDGKRISTPNFPFIDSKERLWVSNSTYRESLEEAIKNPAPDGAIVLIEKGSARIVAEGIYFANGIAIDESERYLYVAETTKRDILQFKIADDGSLYDRVIYGPETLAPLGVPDGIAFDEAGNLWVTFPRWNAIGYISPERDLHIVLEDPDRKILKRPSNICFGWEDRRTAFIGSLDGNTIPYFKVPYPGMKLIHQS